MAQSHYVRTLGSDGGVDPCEGPAIGLELSAMVADGIPPWRVSLEVLAGLAEILSICEEDGVFHGAVRPACVFVDETAAVSLEGFGQPNQAPEGGAATAAGDRYGLGLVMASLLGSPPPPRDLAHDEHEDAVVDLVLGTDLTGLPGAMQGDLQWFLGRLLAHDPAQRPPSIEVWRTLLAFARSVDGPEVPRWCDLALDGGGERRTLGGAPADASLSDSFDADPTDAADGADSLDRAARSTGPLAAPMAFEPTGSGQPGTAMFTRQQLRDGLRAAEAPAGVGGGGATGHWSQDELKAMREGRDAPAPQRADGEVAKRRTLAVPKPVRAPHSQRRNATPRPRGRAEPPATASPPAVPLRAREPEVDLGDALVPEPPEGAASEGSSGRALMLVAGVALVSMVLGFGCAGVGAAALLLLLL